MLNIFFELYEIDKNDVIVYFTGSAGFHVLIPPEVMGVEPHPHLPLIYKHLTDRLFPGDRFRYIDRSVYSEGKGRMWRLPNKRRQNGLHKIQVDIEEVFAKDARYFFELAKFKRQIVVNEEPKLSKRMQVEYETVRLLTEMDLQNYNREIGRGEVDVIPRDYIAPCIKKIMESERRIQNKNYNEISLLLATYFANMQDMGLVKAAQTLKGFFSLYPSRSYPTPEKREKEFKKKFKFIVKNNVKWNCGYAAFLNVCDTCAIRLEREQKKTQELYEIKSSVYLNPVDNTFHLENMPEVKNHKKLADMKLYEPLTPITVDELLATFNKWYKNYDNDLVRVVLATVITHFFDGPPVWLLIRGAPSSGKTEIIVALDALPFTVDASDLTPKALFSSDIIVENKRKRTAAWIAELNHKILLFRDFTNTINSKNPNDRKEILSELRGIYDGKYSRVVGRKGIKILWEGKIGMIGAATILYDNLTIIEGEQFGERMIVYKLKRNDEESIIDFLEQNLGQEEQRRYEIKRVFLRFFHNLKVPKMEDIEVPEEIKKKVGFLQKLVARARAPMQRKRGNDTIINVPEIEQEPRLEIQMLMLLKALAVIEGRKKVNHNDYRIICKIILSNIPNMRFDILRFLYYESKMALDPARVTAEYIANNLNYTRRTVEYHLEELVSHPVSLVQRYKSLYEERDWGSRAPIYSYTLVDYAKRAFDLIDDDIIQNY